MSRRDDLDAVDELLSSIKQLLRRPGYRKRFMAALGVPIVTSTLRVVRAVQRLSPPAPFIGDVAEYLAIDASTATRFVDQAVSEQLIVKEPDQTDQRRISLHLTDSGLEVLRRADAARHEVLGEVMKEWSSQELRELATYLRRLDNDLGTLERE